MTGCFSFYAFFFFFFTCSHSNWVLEFSCVARTCCSGHGHVFICVPFGSFCLTETCQTLEGMGVVYHSGLPFSSCRVICLRLKL